jgi:uncharacterized protein (TIRG00374 family)
VVIALLVLYARTVHWGAAWRAIRSASPMLLVLATLANLVTLLVKAVTWWIFLRPAGVRSFGLALRATAAGAGINNILIANSGEAARAVFVTRISQARGSAVLAALALERLFDFVGYIILVICAAFLLPMPHDVMRWRSAAVGTLLAVVILFAILLRQSPSEAVVAGASPTTLLARLRAHGARFVGSLGAMVSLPRLGAALALTGVNWGAQIVSYHLTAMAAHFPISLVGSITTLITVNVGFLLRATPGNVGVFQVVYAVTASALGLSKDAAVGVALLLQTIQNVPVTVLGAALAPNLVMARGPDAPPTPM